MSKSYFNKLNYTLANEDTSLELAILNDNADHVLCVAGSGARALPLLARNPKRLTCVDLSQEQLYLTELRIESARVLTHEEFKAFWGYPPRSLEPPLRCEMFERICLTSNAKKYLSEVFEQANWESILYLGKWEQTIAKLSRINRTLTGVSGLGLFSALNATEQNRYLANKFPVKSWSVVIALLGNASIFNSLLYKGHFPKKNISGSMHSFYQNAFKRIFKQGSVRSNFFIQLLFFGKILFSEGCPVECDPNVYSKVQAALNSSQLHVDYVLGSIVDIAATNTGVDFVSISDVPSYFSGATEKNFMQKIKKGMALGGILVLRNYLRVPEGTDLNGFETVTSQYLAPIQQEKLQVYQVVVYRRTS